MDKPGDMASKRSSNSFQNLAVGTLAPLPGISGIYINGAVNFAGALNGVTLAPMATGLMFDNSTDSFTVSRGISSVRLSTNEVAIGASVIATGSSVTAVGVGVTAIGPQSVAIGYGASSRGTQSVVVGSNSNSTNGDQGASLGFANSVNADYGVAVGYQETVSADGAIAVGHISTLTHTDSVVIGSHGASLAANVATLGSNTVPLHVHETGEVHRYKYVPGLVTASPAVGDILGGILIYPDTALAPITMTLPSAASFGAAIGNACLPNTGVRCLVVNRSTFAVTVSAGADADWTILDSLGAGVIAANTSRDIIFTKSSLAGAVVITCSCYM